MTLMVCCCCWFLRVPPCRSPHSPPPPNTPPRTAPPVANVYYIAFAALEVIKLRNIPPKYETARAAFGVRRKANTEPEKTCARTHPGFRKSYRNSTRTSELTHISKQSAPFWSLSSSASSSFATAVAAVVVCVLLDVCSRDSRLPPARSISFTSFPRRPTRPPLPPPGGRILGVVGKILHSRHLFVRE